MNRYLPDVAESTVAPTAAPTDPLYVLKQSAEKLLFEFEIPKDDWLRLMAETGNADDFLGGLSDRVAYCDKLRSLCLAEVAKRIPERIRQAALDHALERQMRNGWGGEIGLRSKFIDRCRPLFGWCDICITDEICKALGLSTIRDLEYWPTDQDEAFRRVADYAKEVRSMNEEDEKRIDQIRALFNPIWEKHGIDLVRAPWDTVNKYCKLAFTGRDWENIITSARPEDTPEALAQILDKYLTDNPPEKATPKPNGKKSAPAEKVEPKKGDEIPFDLDDSKLKALPGVKAEENDALEASSSPDIEATGDTGHAEPGRPQQPASAPQELPKIVDHPPMNSEGDLLVLKQRAKKMVLDHWNEAIPQQIADVCTKAWDDKTAKAICDEIGLEEATNALQVFLNEHTGTIEEALGVEFPAVQKVSLPEIELPPTQPSAVAVVNNTAIIPSGSDGAAIVPAQTQTRIVNFPTQQEFQQLDTYAKLLSKSGFYPALNTYEKAMVVLLKGFSLGVDPMSSADGIEPIETTDSNGNKKISMNYRARLLKALCERTGQVEKFQVVTDERKAVAYVKRKGHPEAVYTYTWEDAETAKLTTKYTWQKYPKNMLTARAISKAADVEFPDVRYAFTMMQSDED